MSEDQTISDFFAPVYVKRASEAIYEQIKDLIISGKLRPGDILPSERAMTDMMQRSRPTIREALRMLERAGLIKIIPGKSGAVVMEPTANNLKQPLRNLISFQQLTNRELLEFRALIEVEFAGWAAERRSSEQLEDLKLCLEEAKAHTDNAKQFFEQDLRFHRLMLQAARNGLAEMIVEVMHELVMDALQKNFYKLSATQQKLILEDILKKHTEIYQTIKQQDMASAKIAMRKHLSAFEKLIGD